MPQGQHYPEAGYRCPDCREAGVRAPDLHAAPDVPDDWSPRQMLIEKGLLHDGGSTPA
jgi:hypothetical protein